MENETLIDWTPVEDALNAYGQEVAQLYKQNIIKSDHLATENLLNSISYALAIDGRWFKVTLSLADYWRYVEYGRRSIKEKPDIKMPPADAIRKWIRVRAILPSEVTLEKVVQTKTKGSYIKQYHPTENQLVYLMQKSIQENGIKGSYDLTNAVEECNRKHKERIAAALQQVCSGLVVQWMANYF